MIYKDYILPLYVEDYIPDCKVGVSRFNKHIQAAEIIKHST